MTKSERELLLYLARTTELETEDFDITLINLIHDVTEGVGLPKRRKDD